MEQFMVFLLILSFLFVFYTYFGYIICLYFLSILKNESKTSLHPEVQEYFPTVTLIITAYNEQERIGDKIENTLKIEYPKDKFDVIIASDCSSDSTDSIVKSYKKDGIRLVRATERKGKENAQKCAVLESKGEILVFSDVATIIEPNGIACIVKNFQNPRIGCVSSEDKFINSKGEISGEGAYVKYEMFLRKLESKVNTLVGLSGSFFAARKEVCNDWAVDLQSDFNTLLNSIKLGMTGTIDPNSLGFYKNIADEKKEFNRKVRTVLRGMSVLMSNLKLMNPFKYGLFSWQLFSHKLCRWLVPFFLILGFTANAVLSIENLFFGVLFLGQCLFYILGLIYFFSSKLKKQTSILKIPYYFILVNYSILVAWIKYIQGRREVLWEPSKR